MKVTDKAKPAAILAMVLLVALSNACHNTPPAPRYDLTIIRVDQGWGYEIRKNNKLFIYQDCIPAIPGNQPFTDRKSAKATGRLVLEKLRNHQIPSVSGDELEELGVIMHKGAGG